MNRSKTSAADVKVNILPADSSQGQQTNPTKTWDINHGARDSGLGIARDSGACTQPGGRYPPPPPCIVMCGRKKKLVGTLLNNVARH